MRNFRLLACANWMAMGMLAIGCHFPPSLTPDQQLQQAVGKGDVKAAQAAIDVGANPNATPYGAESHPLFMAAQKGDISMARLLIEQGADANFPGAPRPGDINTFRQGIPLNAAAGRLDLPIVQLLLNNEANPNADLENSGGMNTPLQAAIGGATPRYDHAVSSEQHETAVAIIKLLIERGAQPTKPTYGELLPPLHWAAEIGDLPLAKWLVEHGYDVKSTTWNNYSALYHAASGGNVEFIRWLLDQQVEISTENENHWSPLYFAVVRGRTAAVRVLLEEAGCNVNGDGDPAAIYGGTPLHWAVQQNQLEIVTQLVNAGADLALKNKAGLTPLGIALQQLEQPGTKTQPGRQEIVDFLRAQNAPE